MRSARISGDHRPLPHDRGCAYDSNHNAESKEDAEVDQCRSLRTNEVFGVTATTQLVVNEIKGWLQREGGCNSGCDDQLDRKNAVYLWG